MNFGVNCCRRQYVIFELPNNVNFGCHGPKVRMLSPLSPDSSSTFPGAFTHDYVRCVLQPFPLTNLKLHCMLLRNVVFELPPNLGIDISFSRTDEPSGKI